ncbi:MAG: hydroxymyristoyl-ACP dehydratase [Bacteroidetes bacterium]|jgi:3-hydroxyacyl-[acyl-carrier-protein] dehydratase|nr:hydroxymyristoyl-ACP dehydratase [Bacteroidota bacterium]
MNFQTDILPFLPYDKPFLFVDDIVEIKEGYIKGHYTFTKDAEFYKGHFKQKPVTPGVLLTECAAQIGLVCYAIFKMDPKNHSQFGMTSANMEFLKPHFPDQKIMVEAEEVYYRFGKLKMNIKVLDLNENILVRGQIAGMPVKYKDEE